LGYRGFMDIRLGSVVIVLMMFFLAKISLETAITPKIPENVSERSPASIDQSYTDHLARR
jgi:hypothetical protein